MPFQTHANLNLTIEQGSNDYLILGGQLDVWLDGER